MVELVLLWEIKQSVNVYHHSQDNVVKISPVRVQVRDISFDRSCSYAHDQHTSRSTLCQ